MNPHVLAVIVLYNPDLTVLDVLINSIFNQVGNVYIVDNTPSPDGQGISKLLEKYKDSCNYLPLNDNLGIATAQNKGINWARNNGYSRVLLLDQDSLLPDNMVTGLLSDENELLRSGYKVAAVGPTFIDQKTNETTSAIETGFLRTIKKKNNNDDNQPVKSDYIIASGSLIRLSVIETFGAMKDELFIDWVDIEWGERCNAYGYYSFISKKVIMQHSIGDSHAKILGRTVYLHSDFRNYFIVRNAVYLSKQSTIRWKLRLSMLMKTPYYIVLFSFLSEKKVYSFKLLFRAALDGLLNRMEKGYFK